jgi:hypothetical protein
VRRLDHLALEVAARRLERRDLLLGRQGFGKSAGHGLAPLRPGC